MLDTEGGIRGVEPDKSGCPLEMLGGWKKMGMVMRYAHFSTDSLAGYAELSTRDRPILRAVKQPQPYNPRHSYGTIASLRRVATTRKPLLLLAPRDGLEPSTR